MRNAAIYLATLFGLNALLGASPVTAGETIWYGSRIGMEVAVVGKSGIGTSRAVIKIRMTKQKAAEHCTYYVGDTSAGCVKRLLKEDGARLKPTVSGNCENGAFSDMYGYKYIFKGRNKDLKGDFAPEYTIVDRKTGKALEDSSVSGYQVALGVFQALCPKYKSQNYSHSGQVEANQKVTQQKSYEANLPDNSDWGKEGIPLYKVSGRELLLKEKHSVEEDWDGCLRDFESNKYRSEDGSDIVAQEIDLENQIGYQVLVNQNGLDVFTARCAGDHYYEYLYRVRDESDPIPMK